MVLGPKIKSVGERDNPSSQTVCRDKQNRRPVRWYYPTLSSWYNAMVLPIPRLSPARWEWLQILEAWCRATSDGQELRKSKTGRIDLYRVRGQSGTLPTFDDNPPGLGGIQTNDIGSWTHSDERCYLSQDTVLCMNRSSKGGMGSVAGAGQVMGLSMPLHEVSV